jgi:hypothetical protein
VEVIDVTSPIGPFVGPGISIAKDACHGISRLLAESDNYRSFRTLIQRAYDLADESQKPGRSDRDFGDRVIKNIRKRARTGSVGRRRKATYGLKAAVGLRPGPDLYHLSGLDLLQVVREAVTESLTAWPAGETDREGETKEAFASAIADKFQEVLVVEARQGSDLGRYAVKILRSTAENGKWQADHGPYALGAGVAAVAVTVTGARRRWTSPIRTSARSPICCLWSVSAAQCWSSWL